MTSMGAIHGRPWRPSSHIARRRMARRAGDRNMILVFIFMLYLVGVIVAGLEQNARQRAAECPAHCDRKGSGHEG